MSVYCTEHTNEEFPACDVKGRVQDSFSEFFTMKSTDLLCIITLYLCLKPWNKVSVILPREEGRRRKEIVLIKSSVLADVNISQTILIMDKNAPVICLNFRSRKKTLAQHMAVWQLSPLRRECQMGPIMLNHVEASLSPTPYYYDH